MARKKRFHQILSAGCSSREEVIDGMRPVRSVIDNEFRALDKKTAANMTGGSFKERKLRGSSPVVVKLKKFRVSPDTLKFK